MIQRRLHIRGRVQGVFFRDTTRRVATEAGVAGWASNRADGTVEVVLEGEAPAVERVIEFCRRGPAGAAVERADVAEAEPEGLQGFTIR